MNLSAADHSLHELALAKAANYRLAESELLDVIDRVDRSKLYLKVKCNSLHAYCTDHLGLTTGTAYNFTCVVHKSRKVPELKQAVTDGMSIANARRIAPVLTPENQAEWIVMAETLPRAKLERALAEAAPETARVESARPRAGNRVELNVNVSAELMEQLRRAQDLVSQSQGRFATLEDTIQAMTAEFIKRKDPVAKADRNLARANSAEINQVHARDRGACQMIKANGAVCGRSRFTHVHHRVPRHLGGGDEPANLVTLCSACHRLWHVEEERRWAVGDVAGTEQLDMTWDSTESIDSRDGPRVRPNG